MTILLGMLTSKVSALVAVVSLCYGFIFESQGFGSALMPFVAAILGALSILVPSYWNERRQRRKDQASQSVTASAATDKVSELTASERQELRQIMLQLMEEQRQTYDLRHKEDQAIIELYKQMASDTLKRIEVLAQQIIASQITPT